MHKKILLIFSSFLLISYTNHSYSYTNKKKIRLRINFQRTLLGISKIWLAYYATYKISDNPFTEERKDRWWSDYHYSRGCKSMREFMIQTLHETPSLLPPDNSCATYIRLLTYWAKNDAIMLKPIKPLVRSMSTFFFLSGIYDIYQSFQWYKKPIKPTIHAKKVTFT